MSDRLADEDLARLEELEKISPSVWGMNISGYCGEPTYKITPQYTSAGGMSMSDAKLAVTARNALPALLAEIRASRAEIAGLKSDLATTRAERDALVARATRLWKLVKEDA